MNIFMYVIIYIYTHTYIHRVWLAFLTFTVGDKFLGFCDQKFSYKSVRVWTVTRL